MKQVPTPVAEARQGSWMLACSEVFLFFVSVDLREQTLSEREEWLGPHLGEDEEMEKLMEREQQQRCTQEAQ
jgi:hypothetical protein